MRQQQQRPRQLVHVVLIMVHASTMKPKLVVTLERRQHGIHQCFAALESAQQQQQQPRQLVHVVIIMAHALMVKPRRIVTLELLQRGIVQMPVPLEHAQQRQQQQPTRVLAWGAVLAVASNGFGRVTNQWVVL